jgi:glycosyltransferase involved in cell wall biosynthesis
MVKDLALSVVLATYNRADTLCETLRYLAAQELDPATYEVIVVDDGSPDHTRHVVEEWQARAPYQLTYLHHSNHGAGYTQNRGIEAARAPVVLLMADDIFMLPQALKSHLALHVAHPETEVAVLGRVDESHLAMHTTHPAQELAAGGQADGSRPIEDSVFLRNWDKFGMGRWAGSQELPYYMFWVNNISAKRDFLLRHGAFREQPGRAGPAAHHDIVLGYRLSRFGLRILYSEEARGLHCHPTTFEAACRRRYMEGLNFGELHHYAPAPEIPVVYHVLNWRTLFDHARAVFGPRRRFLPAHDRNPISLLLRHAARACAFNFLTVPLLWERLVRMAEEKPAIARLMNSQIYRFVLYHHFLRGCRDGHRRYDRPRARLGTAPASSR